MDYTRRDLLTLTAMVAAAGSASAAEGKRGPLRFTPPELPAVLSKSWTAAETIPLWPADPPGHGSHTPQPLPADWRRVFLRNVAKPDLHVFRAMRSNRQGLLVIPGGSYQFVSVSNEGFQLAERLNALGFTVFVLTYRLPGEGWTPRADVPLQDAQRAVRVIRSQASRFEIDARSLATIGFSAGGHLTATLATEHGARVYEPIDALDSISARPFAAALIYPVVTMLKPWTHDQSRQLLLGDNPSEAEVTRRSPELHVNEETPPTFVVHATDDALVPVENSIRWIEAMRAVKRPVEAHLLEEGGHAFGVGYANSPSQLWTALLEKWLDRLRVRIGL